MYTPRKINRPRPKTPGRTATPAKRALDFGVRSAKRVRYSGRFTPLVPSAGTRKSIKTNYRLELGEPVGSSSCKNRTSIDETTDTTLYPSNTLVQFGNVISIPQGTAINQRINRLVNLRGITVDCILSLQAPDAPQVEQIYFAHIALLASKDLTPSSTPSISTTDFFRGYGSNRGIDFGTSLSALEIMSNAINTDKFEVLMHRKFELSYYTGHNTKTVPSNDLHYKEYIPIERQVRFINETEGSSEDTVHLVLWYTTASSSPLDPLEDLRFRHRTIVHYRDPIN